VKSYAGGRTPLYWIGGWASDLQCWDGLLRETLPEFDILFLDVHNFLDSTQRLEHLLSVAPAGTCLAGWSLGSLVVERLLREQRVPLEMAVVNICPFLDFCDPEGPWKPLVLRRMVRRIFGDAPGVLTEFATNMGLDGLVKENWMRQAVEMQEEVLADGLSALETTKFAAPWAEHPRRLFVVSPDDRIAPPCSTPEADTRHMPAGSGHVPFLNHPEPFHEILRELAGRL
jgi:pimeloyl-ACP methyl ester carboxylesterase